MCRNIKTLFNFEPPATDEEIYASSMQYVRKVSGFKKPSKLNEKVFEQAIIKISKTTKELLESLETNTPFKNREEVAAKAKERAALRFAPK
jgi:hypothetical protein